MKKKQVIPRKKVKVFKIKNRSGYAALYQTYLTEGRSPIQAYDRLLKAVNRRSRRR